MSGPEPRHNLTRILEALHRLLGSPLDESDSRLWKRSMREFADESKTAVKYQSYGHRHPHLYDLAKLQEEEIFDPDFRAVLLEALREPSHAAARRKLLASGVITEVIKDYVFSFRVFSVGFCELLMEEIRHFYGSKLPARRPNSMNNYGIILNEIGLETLPFALQDFAIQPLASILFPKVGSELDSHHTFTIRYKGGEDTHLDVHTDDSDVTFNVNIFGNYSGAPLVFCGVNGKPDHRKFKIAYQHQLGHAVLHLGNHRHGAEDITSGERMNLVVWSYSYNFRSSKESEKKHQREDGPPDVRCVSYTHDRDFGRFRSWPPGKKQRHLGRGWCPPRGKEYEGFVADVPDTQAQGGE